MSKTQASSKHPKPSAHQVMLRVVQYLRDAGFEALLAGGCVRDMLLGQQPNDYDIATNATPDSITKIFRNTLSVGAQFGVVVVLMGGHQIEVATFRSDDSYHDGRRPASVVFTDAEHDAQRRDFTINGMFFDPLTERVIDYVGGTADLRGRVIRAIGNPDERFAEDHLRMLRALRFACRLGFTIESATYQAICDHALKIAKISAERIAGELEQILTDPSRVQGVELAQKTGLLAACLPILSDQKVHAGLAVLQQLPEVLPFHLALAALLVDCTPSEAAQVCRKLKTSNDVRRHTVFLLEKREALLQALPLTPGRLKRWLAEPLFENLFCFTAAQLRATGQNEDSLQQLRNQIEQLGDAPIAPPPLLDGHALIGLGAPPGPIVGRLAEEMYLAQLEGEIADTDQAAGWVKAWLHRHHTD
ncbi:MAG: hypothetical protein JW936_01010 [Sedimentisphaerales bacterium]|nr:hypothetical protein [Sedimentisphaerales bacterium]